MTISVTNLTSTASTADNSGQPVPGVALDADKAYLLTFAAYNTLSTQPTVNLFSHGNWTLIGSIDFDTIPVNQGTLFVYYHYGTAVASTTMTITFHQTIYAFAASIDVVTGFDPANPFPQWTGREDNVSPETTNTLGTMVDSNSRSFAAYAKNTNTASVYTLETNWTLLAEENIGTPTLHLTTAWSDTNGADTATSWTQTTGSQAAGNIILEIAANAGTNVTVTALPGAFSFAGAAPLVSVTGGDVNISPLPGAFSFAGTAPAVSGTTDATITAPAGQFSFGATAPTLEGTLTEESGGPSLGMGGGTWGYLSIGAEKSLRDR